MTAERILLRMCPSFFGLAGDGRILIKTKQPVREFRAAGEAQPFLRALDRGDQGWVARGRGPGTDRSDDRSVRGRELDPASDAMIPPQISFATNPDSATALPDTAGPTRLAQRRVRAADVDREK